MKQIKDKFLIDLELDIQWRISKVASIKTLPYRYKIRETDKQLIILFAIPMIYSIWEGFVVNTFTLFSRCLNSERRGWKELDENLLTHSIESETNIFGLSDFNKKKKTLGDLIDLLEGDAKITQKIPTKSNINYTVLNDILKRFNLKELNVNYKRKLNKLLLFRNAISHGDTSIPVSQDVIDELSMLVNELMYEVEDIIKDGLIENCHLNKK